MYGNPEAGKKPNVMVAGQKDNSTNHDTNLLSKNDNSQSPAALMRELLCHLL